MKMEIKYLFLLNWKRNDSNLNWKHISLSNLKVQGTKAFIWDFTGKIMMQGMGFIVSIFLAHLLEPSDFGLIAMIMAIISIASIFSDIGLGAALIQRRRVLQIHYSSVFYFNITIGTLLTLLTFVSAPFIAKFYNNQALIPLVQVVSFSFIIGAISAVQSTKLRKELNYALLTKIKFVASLISGIVGVSLALYGIGVWSLVAQTLTQGIIYSALIWIISRWAPSAGFSLKALMQLWAFGFRMFLVALLETIFTRLDVIIIGRIFPPATLGYFNRAKSLDQIIIEYSSGSLMSVLFPVLSKIKNDLPRFQNIIIKSLGIIVFIVFLLLGNLYLVSHELIILIFGGKWLQSVEYFKILVLSGFGYPLSALLVNVLISRGNSKSFLRLDIYKKILFGINLTIGFMWGVEGYLYGLFVAWLLAVYLNIIFASIEIQLSKVIFLKLIIIQILITVVSTIAIKYLNCNLNYNYNYFIMLLIKSFEYTTLYITLNSIFKTDAYKYFMGEAKPAYNKLLYRIRK